MNLEKLSVESAKKESTVHFFPCEIKYNGEAEVDRYFNTSVKSCEGEDGGEYMYHISIYYQLININDYMCTNTL